MAELFSDEVDVVGGLCGFCHSEVDEVLVLCSELGCGGVVVVVEGGDCVVVVVVEGGDGVVEGGDFGLELGCG